MSVSLSGKVMFAAMAAMDRGHGHLRDISIPALALCVRIR
jgi:hypothetical protein